ncbi:aminotransferase class IV [Demequina sp.]|uniref:aminotransferase class IV n=1 Tax=Demequina sp. TaxID=2050685 RepID=UPI0025CC156F|nr:aminotransferase class IV [Demequina sp.]
MPALVICGAPAAGMPGEPSRVVDPVTPVVRATDLGFTRGDGVFETVGIHGGRVHDMEPHLERLAESAAMLDLPAPDRGAFREAIAMAVAALLDQLDEVPETALCKIVYSRGDEHAAHHLAGGRPFGIAYADVFPDITRERTLGIDVITLTRGYPRGIGDKAPWLLAGAKTLSYAVNMAALRHAAARGADDVILTTTDGFALEAPRSSLLVRLGDDVVTPAVEGGLLHGTAQRAAFASLGRRGFACEYRDVRVDELPDADALWLTDSVQLLRPVRSLDGVARDVDSELTAAVLADLVAGG